ncbi:FAD/NAD(P)-binding domain-containing protein [Tuber magnatum]|uniref:FAD/NAD(P)-binding domain-containing protein n=1 Tax=Tuber magnatum TaxID=42249 RepID=A0A317SHL0_9PEZI|nr:FAD/NAD(P)-binding domain-containing protein [Tuber magnatum]
MGLPIFIDSAPVSIKTAQLPVVSPPTAPLQPPELHSIAKSWLLSLSQFLSSREETSLRQSFLQNSYWRDHPCLSWYFHTFHGPAEITSFVAKHPKGIRIKAIDLDAKNSSAVSLISIDRRGNLKGIRLMLTVSTDVGSGRCLAKLVRDESDGKWKTYTLYTALHSLEGHEEILGSRRPNGVTHGVSEERQSWKDRRTIEQEFIEEEPAVLIIGAGQGGLTAAARLKMLGVRCLIIEKNENIGGNWRKRYHQLVLHDPVYCDHLPYFPCPPIWPAPTPKDKSADWSEAYAKAMELNIWMSSTLTGTPTYSSPDREWRVTISRNGALRTLHSRHIIMATGLAGEPNIPVFPGAADLKGDRLCHSSQFSGARANSKGLKAVIVGCCNSAHGIAQDYYEQGAEVTMVQRSSTYVMTSESGVGVLLKGFYDEGGPPLEDADLMFQAATFPVLKRRRLDKATLDGLAAAGFKLDEGPDRAGFYIKYLERGGGYYLDVGASSLVASGKLKVKQVQEIKRILPNGIEFADGHVNMHSTARKIFGDEMARSLKPVRGMWRRCGRDGFWFMGGKPFIHEVLQIKALEEGLMCYDDF